MKGGVEITTHLCKCLYCKEQFDINTCSYVKPRSNRYAHSECYTIEREKNSQLPELEIIVPEEQPVVCVYCKQPFKRSENPSCVEIKHGKFAHKACAEQGNDKEKLYEYICHLYSLEFVPPRVQKQLAQFKENYRYTYTGMAKTLEFMYEVKHIPIDKTAFNKYGLGLLKNFYDQAHDYYYAIWEAQQNQQRVLKESPDDLVIRQVEIIIPPPKRQEKKKRHLFNFLDKEED